jgi:hypothetical protein
LEGFLNGGDHFFTGRAWGLQADRVQMLAQNPVTARYLRSKRASRQANSGGVVNTNS